MNEEFQGGMQDQGFAALPLTQRPGQTEWPETIYLVAIGYAAMNTMWKNHAKTSLLQWHTTKSQINQSFYKECLSALMNTIQFRPIEGDARSRFI